jgi:hypothetical protein
MPPIPKSTQWTNANPEKARVNWQRAEAKRTAKVDARRDALLAAQGGVCAICETSDPGKHGWNLDHDHRCCPQPSGRSCGHCDRGVLCVGCNMRLVAAVESPLLQKAIDYVNTP